MTGRERRGVDGKRGALPPFIGEKEKKRFWVLLPFGLFGQVESFLMFFSCVCLVRKWVVKVRKWDEIKF